MPGVLSPNQSIMTSLFGGLLWLLTFALPVAAVSGAIAGVLVICRKQRKARSYHVEPSRKAEVIATYVFRSSAIISAAGIGVMLMIALAAGLELVKIEAF